MWERPARQVDRVASFAGTVEEEECDVCHRLLNFLTPTFWKSGKERIMKETWYFSWPVVGFSVLIVAQYILAFFIFKLPGLRALQILGWGIWALSAIFGFAPIFILRTYGGVANRKSYVHTTKLVDTSLYAVVRHPQYLSGILFNIALMLLAQHWLVILIGIISMILIYLTIRDADREGLDKFGEAYQDYMKRVPQINFLKGIFRLVRTKHARIAKHLK